ncbi:MAG: ribosomal protein S18-alanine N-acetyltransferase [Desulfonatronovibrionaceae bacterium]
MQEYGVNAWSLGVRTAARLRVCSLDNRRLGELVEIEREIFLLPWGEREYTAFFLQQTSLALGVLDRGRLVGFITCFNMPGELEVLNLAVREGYRRQRLGTSLLLRAVGVFRETSSGGSVFLEVRESNRPAIALYTKLGFARSGVRENYYLDSGEDAWIMRLDL